MSKDHRTLIKKIHQSDYKFCISLSGGGTNLASSLLSVPGASNSILEVFVPYSRESIQIFLNKIPDHYCSLETTLNMASMSFKKTQELTKENHDKDVKIFGIGITASLKTIDKKKGGHRFYIVSHNAEQTTLISCNLQNNMRSRIEEEELLSEMILKLIANNCNIKTDFPEIPEGFKIHTTEAEPLWSDLLANKLDFVSNTKNKPELIFPGSFNPLHEGHKKMKTIAEEKTGMDLFYEICIKNVDKPPLTFYQIQKTISQFDSNQWVLTTKGRFFEKAKLFPNSIFVIGFDTLNRMLDEKYYASKKDMLEKLDVFNDFNNSFLVFGRKDLNVFRSMKDISIPSHIKKRFSGFGEKEFRDDVSSSAIRKRSL